jgi:hypothetical protein
MATTMQTLTARETTPQPSMDVQGRFDYAVKRGKCFTRFPHALPAFRYWRSTLGSVLLIRSESTGKWKRA